MVQTRTKDKVYFTDIGNMYCMPLNKEQAYEILGRTMLVIRRSKTIMGDFENIKWGDKAVLNNANNNDDSK